ncbi:hypothetical protein ZEAMMB73_Zm00001d040325 [Zea mays]|uniref:Uncharacterized protein n=1 Tax=Zea mays TaxID=4577 RepID=A0A1D6MQ79_MAIZE|nr:hypothetical protein ZEAMMB73_Zm00001d040325 [Zea mays]ONM31171.1 hypothetical protein ZEAMMB73_Zm00001d040325 [Zea mays]
MVAENLAPGYGLEQRLPNGSSKKGTPRSASQRWMPDKPRTPSSRRTYSIGEPGKLTTGFSRSARMGNLNPRDRAFASLSNIADLKSAADAATEDLDNEFDHIDESHYVARRAYHSPLCSSQAVSLEVAATATGTGAKPSRVSFVVEYSCRLADTTQNKMQKDHFQRCRMERQLANLER